jgi:hypothetical protein
MRHARVLTASAFLCLMLISGYLRLMRSAGRRPASVEYLVGDIGPVLLPLPVRFHLRSTHEQHSEYLQVHRENVPQARNHRACACLPQHSVRIRSIDPRGAFRGWTPSSDGHPGSCGARRDNPQLHARGKIQQADSADFGGGAQIAAIYGYLRLPLVAICKAALWECSLVCL